MTMRHILADRLGRGRGFRRRQDRWRSGLGVREPPSASQATAAKVRHLRANPHVTVHFHTDPAAEHVLVVVGTAAVADRPRPSDVPAYLHKYEASFPAVGYDRNSFDASFNTCIRITPERAWGF